MRPLLFTLLGAYHLVLGAFMVVLPEEFYDQIATYGPYNDHFIRDLATPYLALGGVMLVAAARRSWQQPVLVFAVAQYALHVLNHIWDIDDAEPSWLGPFNAVSLALITALLWWMLRRAPETAPAPEPPPEP